MVEQLKFDGQNGKSFDMGPSLYTSCRYTGTLVWNSKPCDFQYGLQMAIMKVLL